MGLHQIKFTALLGKLGFDNRESAHEILGMNALIVLIGISTAAWVHAQDLQTPSANRQVQVEPKTKELVLTVPERRKSLFEKVKVGGLLIDLMQAEKPLKLLDPRNPGKFNEDPANLYADPVTNKPKGFVLLSFKF